MKQILTQNWTEDMSVTIYGLGTIPRIGIDSEEEDVVAYTVEELQLPQVAGTIILKAILDA